MGEQPDQPKDADASTPVPRASERQASARGCTSPGSVGEEPDLDLRLLGLARCERVAYVIVDVVTRYWIGHPVSTERAGYASAAAVRAGRWG